MAEMGRYCKAYLVSDLQKYEGWDPDLDALRQPEPEKPDEEIEERTELQDDDILYVQEDLIVTDGIFKDEHVVFSDDSDAWKTFCEEEIGFEIPEDVREISRAAEEEAGEGEGGEDEGEDEGDDTE